MRVVQLCEAFSRSSETFIYDTVTELERQGIDCHVLTMNRVNEDERPFEKVHLAPRPGRWHLPRLWRRALATFSIAGNVGTHTWPIIRSRFRRHLERLNPDVIHAQFGPMGVLVAPIAEALNTPLVVTFHGHDISVVTQNEDARGRYRALFRKADALTGVSNYNCHKLRKLGAPEKKVHVLHNGTKIENFDYSNPFSRYNGRDIYLLHVGRLVEKKSPLDLLESFRLAQNELNDGLIIHLKIAGDGPLYNTMTEYIDHYSIENVQCLGRVEHKEVKRLMGKSHIYTQHCKTASDGDEEGQGVTFVEAQASGLPVVATNHNGIPDVVIDGKTGYLVPEGDTEAMADRIVYLAHHPEVWDEMGQAGRQHVEKNFSLEKQIKKTIEIYSKLS